MSIRTSLFVTAITAIAGVTALPTAARANPCESQWMKLDNAFKKLSPILSVVICKQLNKDDAEAAQQCVDDYEQKKGEIEALVKVYNTEAGSEKIGPRGLGWGVENPTGTWAPKVYDGTLLAERTFISAPMPSEHLKLSFRGTGGDSKQPYTVTVCVLDETGDSDRSSQVHEFATNSGRWELSLPAVFQKRVMVYLKNSKVTLNGHKYELTATPAGVPAVVQQAAATAARKKPPVLQRGPIVAPIGK